MACSYVICNVFTQASFGGNPLAVVLGGEGLSDVEMQDIARQFNYSETTFVLPAQRGGDFQVRIFTPSSEVPFAGHPNIGTAFVLARKGYLKNDTGFVFEEIAGDVPVSVTIDSGSRVYTELTAPESLSIGQQFSAAQIAEVLSLSEADVSCTQHPPVVASVGLPFIVIELASLSALQRAKVNPQALDVLLTACESPFLHLYVRSDDEYDIRTRMFAPTDGVPEDPATGSANCALAALLAHYQPQTTLQQQLRIAQGVEMGRPSELTTTVSKQDGEIIDVKIGGYSVLFADGTLVI